MAFAVPDKHPQLTMKKKTDYPQNPDKHRCQPFQHKDAPCQVYFPQCQSSQHEKLHEWMKSDCSCMAGRAMSVLMYDSRLLRLCGSFVYCLTHFCLFVVFWTKIFCLLSNAFTIVSPKVWWSSEFYHRNTSKITCTFIDWAVFLNHSF